ncbi:MAG: glutathione S-transferase family protein [Polyangiaceae bacterium]
MRLVTIGFSHYCEKARWALDRSKLEYVEEAHAPLLSYASSVRKARSRTVPVLLTDEGAFTDSSDILEYVDPFNPPEKRLYPEHEAMRREVVAIEDKVDITIGPRVRRWAYSWLVREDALVRPLIRATMSRGERVLRPFVEKPILLAIERGLKLSPDLRESLFDKLMVSFEELGAALEGKKYFVGDAFTAADLTFAALVSPCVYPPEQPFPFPPLASLPVGMQKQIEAFRGTRAGTHALQMYREERNAKPFKPE